MVYSCLRIVRMCRVLCKGYPKLGRSCIFFPRQGECPGGCEERSEGMTRQKSVRADGDTSESGPSFARKLDRLFQSVRSPDGNEYTYAEVSAGVAERGVATISDTYLCNLRNGTKENPRIRHVEALADFFGVPVTYFLDGEESARLFDRLETLPAAANAGVRRIALRAVDLSPETLDAVAQIIEHARIIERLHHRQRNPGENTGDPDT